MLAPLVEIRLEDVRHGHRFAPMPRDPPPVVKCGHDLSTPHRRPPPPGRVRCARPGGRRARRLRRLERGRRSRRRRRDRRPRRPGVPGLDRRLRRRQHRREVRRLEAPAGAGRALPELAEARGGVRQGREQGHRRRARRSRRCAPGSAPRSRSASSTSRPTAPTRQCSGSPRSRDKSSLEGALTKEKDVKAAGTHGGFDVFTDSKGSASAIAISDDTALVSNSQAAVTAAIDRLAGIERSPVRLRRLQGHARDAAERQHRRRLRAGLDAAEARRATRSNADPKPRAARCRRRSSTRSRRSSQASAASASRSTRPTRACASAARRCSTTRRPACPSRSRPTCSTACQANSWFAATFGNLDAEHQAGGRSGARHQRRRAEAGLPGRGPARHQAGRPLRAALRRPGASTPGPALRSRRA